MDLLKKRSLLSNLSLWYAASAFLLVTLSTVYLYWSLVQMLHKQDSAFLSDRLQTIRMVLIASPGKFDALKHRVEVEWPEWKFERLYVRVIDAGGRIITQTPGLVHKRDSMFGAADIKRESEKDLTSFAGIFHQPILRALDTSFILSNGQEIRIELALDRTSESQWLAYYRQRLLIVLLVVFLVCAVVGRRMASRAVRPINEMAVTTARIRSSTLHERIAVSKLPMELATLAKTFNEMLDRLEESFSRLSIFSADIAHELRTPINNLAGEMEVALGKARDGSYYRDVMGSALEECQRISHIIDSLLFLARAENPKNELRKERIVVKKELEKVLEFYEAAAAEAGISCSLQAPEGLEISVERTLFHRAIGNLISNAIKHTAPSGTLTITAVPNGKFADIEIKDTGCGIPKEHLPHVFDRFYRVDQSRSKDSGGFGLGLALVKSIASIHGGSVEIGSELDHGTWVKLQLPCESVEPVRS